MYSRTAVRVTHGERSGGLTLPALHAFGGFSSFFTHAVVTVAKNQCKFTPIMMCAYAGSFVQHVPLRLCCFVPHWRAVLADAM